MELSFVGAEKGSVKVNELVFGSEYKESLVHQIIQSQIENEHMGTKKQKTRSEVRGGGAKPRKQKGGGCSRMGTIRSPILRGGGRTFAARVVHSSHKVNKKMHRVAMRSLLSELIRQDRIKIVSELNVDTPKTQAFAAKLKDMDISNVLIVLDSPDMNVILASRNLVRVSVTTVDQISMLDLLSCDQLLFTSSAIVSCGERFS